MKISSLGLGLIAICGTQFCFAQNDQTKPSVHPPASADQKAEPAAAHSTSSTTPSAAADPTNTTPSASTAAQTSASTPAAATATTTPSPATHSAVASTPAVAGANIQLATDDVKERTVKKLAGQHVRDNEGRDLGTVKDFLVDTQTGKTDYAVISSGGVAGIGDKLRLVPIQALKHNGQKGGFALDIREDKWKALSPVSDEEFKSGRFTIADSQRQQIAQSFQHGAEPAKGAGFYSANVSGHLIRASELSGRDVRSGNDRMGEIEAVVLDLEAGTAQALLDPNKDFTGMKSKMLVPFSALTIGSDKRPQVTTLLSRADFQQMSGGAHGSGPAPAASSSGAVASNQNSTPTSATVPGTEKTQATSGTVSTGQSQQVATTTASSPSAATATSAGTENRAATGSASVAQSETKVAAKDETSLASTAGASTEKSAQSEKQNIASSTTQPSATNDLNAEKASGSSPASTTAGTTENLAATGRTSTTQSDTKVATNEDASRASTSSGSTEKIAQTEKQKVASSTTRPSATNELNEEPNSTVDRGASEKAKIAATDASSGSKSQKASRDSAATATDTSRTEQSTTERAGRVAATEKSAANQDENLTPTGQNSADTIPAGTDPALLATARAIRKALDENPAVASTDVRVTPEGGKIVLRGRVNDQKTKTAIVETATREIKGWKIDDQISVDNR